MNEQLKRPSMLTQSDFPPKRGRGRPRRAETTSHPENQQILHTNIAQNPIVDPNDVIDNNMVGSIVYGVIEGSFDSGYFISVKAGKNSLPMRGVVFHPQMINRVNRENDVAPNAKMFERKEFPTPVFGSQVEANNDLITEVEKEIENKPASLGTEKIFVGGNGLEEKLKYEIGDSNGSDQGDFSGGEKTQQPVTSSTDFLQNVSLIKSSEFLLEDLPVPHLSDAKMTKQDEVMKENEDSNPIKKRLNDMELGDEVHVEVHFDEENTKQETPNCETPQMMQLDTIQNGKAVAQTEPEAKETIEDLRYKPETKHVEPMII